MPTCVAVGGGVLVAVLVMAMPAFREVTALDGADGPWPLATLACVLVLVVVSMPLAGVLLWGVNKRVSADAECWLWPDCEKIKRTSGNKITVKIRATISPTAIRRGDNSNDQRLSTTCTESGTRLITSSMLMSIQVEYVRPGSS